MYLNDTDVKGKINNGNTLQNVKRLEYVSILYFVFRFLTNLSVWIAIVFSWTPFIWLIYGHVLQDKTPNVMNSYITIKRRFLLTHKNLTLSFCNEPRKGPSKDDLAAIKAKQRNGYPPNIPACWSTHPQMDGKWTIVSSEAQFAVQYQSNNQCKTRIRLDDNGQTLFHSVSFRDVGIALPESED